VNLLNVCILHFVTKRGGAVGWLFINFYFLLAMQVEHKVLKRIKRKTTKWSSCCFFIEVLMIIIIFILLLEIVLHWLVKESFQVER
jgi:hypothetical protein